MIPHITSVDKKRSKNSKQFVFPSKCPSCGSETIKDYNFITKKMMPLEDAQVKDMNVKKFLLRKLNILYLK